MEEGNQQSSNQPSSAYPGMVHQKVLQPSESFVQELKVSQQSPSNQVRPVQQDTTQSVTQVGTQPQRPAAHPSSIYPEPTKGLEAATSTAPATHPEEEADDSWKNSTEYKSARKKILAVRAVAAIVAVNYGYYTYVNLHSVLVLRNAGIINWQGILYLIISCTLLLLAIGIFRLSDTARFGFVVLSVIMFVVMCYFMYRLYWLTSYALDPHSPEYANSLKTRELIYDGMTVVIAALPIVFFTRPSIKEVFR